MFAHIQEFQTSLHTFEGRELGTLSEVYGTVAGTSISCRPNVRHLTVERELHIGMKLCGTTTLGTAFNW